jgi:hypothetical protein
MTWSDHEIFANISRFVHPTIEVMRPRSNSKATHFCPTNVPLKDKSHTSYNIQHHLNHENFDKKNYLLLLLHDQIGCVRLCIWVKLHKSTRFHQMKHMQEGMLHLLQM